MEALERTVKERNFVLLAAARVLRELEAIAGKRLDGMTLEDLRDLIAECEEVHLNKSRWRLPEDVLILALPEKEKVDGPTAGPS
jgi:hypothetical protein